MSAGWDCHAHLFGPYDRYPLSSERSYTPNEARCQQYLELLHRLGLSNGVLVQPSAYGEDHGLLLDTLAAYPMLRGVAVVRHEASRALRGLRGKGVRAARFSHRSGAGTNFSGSASFDDLCQLAGALADEGLHAELWTDCASLPGIAAQLHCLPVPVVIDHMGGVDVTAGTEAPGFRCLLELLDTGRVWVKLCVYRNVPAMADLELGRPYHDWLVQANPQRLLWGSDWPHLRVTPQPDAALLLQRFKGWVGNARTIECILEHNPALLYE